MKTKKTKKINRILSIVIAFSLILTMYGFIPKPDTTKADSLNSAKVTLSDSDGSATATSTIVFNMGTALSASQYVRVAYHEHFGDPGSATVDCSDFTVTAASTTVGVDYVECTADGVEAADTNMTIIVSNLANPATTSLSYDITVSTHQADGTEIESTKVMIYIIDDITMTATVDSSLTFTVSGTTTAATVNGVDCTENSTATTTPFGTLDVNASSTVCQDLRVTTNADGGYIVTVEQNEELINSGGSNINSFNNAPDDTGSTTAVAWASPTNILDENYTYGHMGLTSNDDDDVNNTAMSNDYNQSGAMYVGLNSTDEVVVMTHTGPADGTTQNKGYATVAYTAEVASLQEAGDYESTLTYICTPTF